MMTGFPFVSPHFSRIKSLGTHQAGEVAQEVVPATGEELASWWPWGTDSKNGIPRPPQKKGLGPVGITMLLTFLHLFF